MYRVATAIRPIPRWQTMVYGWYLPACLALAWLTGAIWVDADGIIGFSHQVINTITIAYVSLRYVFIGSVFLNGGILFAINPKKHVWLGIIWFIGIALILRYYDLYYESAGFAVSIRAFEVPYEAYYICNTGTLLLSSGLSLSIMLIQYWINPRVYKNWSNRIWAWAALAIVAACYISIEFGAIGIFKQAGAILL